MKDPLHSFLAGLLCTMTIQKAKQIYLDWKESHTNVAYLSSPEIWLQVKIELS